MNDGKTANTAIPIPHDRTLLEINDIGEASTAEQYCNAIADYVGGRITEDRCLRIMGMKAVA